MSNENLTPRPLKICKQRQSNAVTPTQRFSHENGFAMYQLPPTSCHFSIDGRVVTHDTLDQQAPKSQIDSSSALCRQPSFKHRLLNRMMSGLTIRTQVNDIEELDEQTENRLSSAKTSREPSRGSTASSERSIKQLNNIDEALAAFPTPPSSNVSSPSSDQSFKTSSLLPRNFVSLSRPTQDITLAAELRIVAYQDHAATERSALALVEIHTTTNCDLRDSKSHLQQSDLDIAVIIDNSLFNSSALLMASCEITSLLASFLNANTDRMAVLCTVSADAQHETSNPCVILPLGCTNLRRLKAKLDSITVTIAQSNSETTSAILKDAHQILLNSERPASIGKSPRKRFANIIFLTAHASAVCANDLIHQDIQTHLLCVGLPQQKEWEKVVCNGWKMCMFNSFLNRGHPSQSHGRRDQNCYNLDSSLQQMIQHARLGQLTGLLTDVVLDIESQSGYSVEETMGGNVYSKIQIGEVKTVIVRLHPVGRPTKPECVDALKWYHFDTAPNGDDLVAVLDRMLGLPKDGMKAKLKYKHSFLPASTTCITSAKCLLRSPLPWLEDKNLARKSISSQAKISLHQRLAEHYATSYEPREALCFLRREFGDGFCKSACPLYIKALADELRYQARISERISLENSPRKPSLRREGPHPGIRIEEEKVNTPSFYVEGYKPKNWISVPDEDISVPDALPRPSFTVAEQLGLDDAASKIWNDLRKMSRGDANGGPRGQQSNLFAAADRGATRSQRATRRMMAKMKGGLEGDQGRRRTISNGSVSGSSTARRSLSMPVRRSSIRGAGGAGRGLSAPWL